MDKPTSNPVLTPLLATAMGLSGCGPTSWEKDTLEDCTYVDDLSGAVHEAAELAASNGEPGVDLNGSRLCEDAPSCNFVFEVATETSDIWTQVLDGSILPNDTNATEFFTGICTERGGESDECAFSAVSHLGVSRPVSAEYVCAAVVDGSSVYTSAAIRLSNGNMVFLQVKAAQDGVPRDPIGSALALEGVDFYDTEDPYGWVRENYDEASSGAPKKVYANWNYSDY